eukprot:c49291_g1_i1 orf=9-182(-)
MRCVRESVQNDVQELMFHHFNEKHKHIQFDKGSTMVHPPYLILNFCCSYTSMKCLWY